MSKPLVMFADPERAVIDYLAPLLSGTTVGATTPAGSTTAPVAPYLLVAWNGTPSVSWPATQATTVRLTAFCVTPTAAKTLLAQAQGELLAHPGDVAIWSVQPLTGGLTAIDPDTQLHMCSATFRVNVRPASAPVTP